MFWHAESQNKSQETHHFHCNFHFHEWDLNFFARCAGLTSGPIGPDTWRGVGLVWITYTRWIFKYKIILHHKVWSYLLGVELNRDPDSQENSEIPFLGASEFLDFNSVSINPSKIINFSSFSLFMEAHEGSLYEKIFFNLIYTDSGICNDPRHRI